MSSENLSLRPKKPQSSNKIELIPFPPLHISNNNKQEGAQEKAKSQKQISHRTITKDGSHILEIPKNENTEKNDKFGAQRNDTSLSSIRKTNTD